MRYLSLALLWTACGAGMACQTGGSVASASPDQTGLRFSIQPLYLDPNEVCTVADVDRDGQLDVIAGRNWYPAPEFVARPLRDVAEWNGYLANNGEHVMDVNRDGWVDLVSGSFVGTEIYWFENPGADGLSKGVLWRRHLLADTGASQNEITFMRDLDGDGVPEWIVNSWKKDAPLVAWSFLWSEGVPGLQKRLIGTQGNGHGIGFGDLNGDGREDILVGTGWYERPAGDLWKAPWTFHPDWDLHASCPMIVTDLDRDGRNDIIWGRGHDYGLYFWQQLPAQPQGRLQWKEHLIDKEFSQPHALAWVDLDGDGAQELVTGKRRWAHNGKDPGGNEPPCLYYYSWDAGALRFTRHTINEGRVGTGLQFQSADLNADGRVDIAVSGKSGTYILFNEGR